LTAKAKSSLTNSIRLKRIAPGIIDRQPVKEPLQTGIKRLTRWFQSDAGSAN
jgi:F0F1-type ATP synthase alpha subunit